MRHFLYGFHFDANCKGETSVLKTVEENGGNGNSLHIYTCMKNYIKLVLLFISFF